MHILIAPDKFKDALSALEVCQAIQEGILEARPNFHCTLLPLADGGEGTAMLLTGYAGALPQHNQVAGPLFQPVRAAWGYHPQKKQAFIELAEASGLYLIPHEARNPLYTSTYGTGELISVALHRGAGHITLGLGGSATNDGGTGMAAALGYRFYDSEGKLISRPCGKDLQRIRHIDAEAVHSLLFKCRFMAACDVDNPLTGPNGAARIFGPQKGASGKDISLLEEGLDNLARVIYSDLGLAVQAIPGAGAAGGAGAGILAFLQGSLQSGAELIMDGAQFSQKLQKAHILVGGEGKLDSSSLQGKLATKLCQQAKERNRRLIFFCGSTSLSKEEARKYWIQEIIPISRNEKNLEAALRNTAANLKLAAAQYFGAAEFD